MKKSSRYGTRVMLNHLQDGDISYYITYKLNGRKYTVKVGKKSEGINEAKAIMFRNKILSEAKHGVNLALKANVKALTFDVLAAEYFSHGSVFNKSNHRSQLIYNKHIQPHIGEKVVLHLKDKDIVNLQNTKQDDELSPATINLIVKLVKKITNFSVKKGFIDYSPFKDIRMFKEDNTRERFLNQGEIGRLYDLVKDSIVMKMFVSLALTTGARATTVLNIKLKDIDFDNKIITLKDFKRGNTYKGFAEDTTLNMIREHAKSFGPNSFIVSVKGQETKYSTLHLHLKTVLDHFNNGLDKTDRKNRVVIHTLRHTFASHLAINGTPIHTIQKLMNHADIKMTLKYAKLSQESGRSNVTDLYKGEQ